MSPGSDPVRRRRERIARGVRWASRAGYLAVGVAVVSFAAGLATDFPTGLVDLTVGGLVAACVILPVTIILGYGIRAADRDDRAR